MFHEKQIILDRTLFFQIQQLINQCSNLGAAGSVIVSIDVYCNAMRLVWASGPASELNLFAEVSGNIKYPKKKDFADFRVLILRISDSADFTILFYYCMYILCFILIKTKSVLKLF